MIARFETFDRTIEERMDLMLMKAITALNLPSFTASSLFD